jgi:hypothetical protein
MTSSLYVSYSARQYEQNMIGPSFVLMEEPLFSTEDKRCHVLSRCAIIPWVQGLFVFNANSNDIDRHDACDFNSSSPSHFGVCVLARCPRSGRVCTMEFPSAASNTSDPITNIQSKQCIQHAPVGRSVNQCIELFDMSQYSVYWCELDRDGGYGLFCSPDPEQILNHAAVGAIEEN